MAKLSAHWPLRLRTVFISDIHLGFKGCSAEMLVEFLQHVEMDFLFLAGGITDLSSTRRSVFWPQSHSNVMRTILGKAKSGTKVILVPGDHDKGFREFDGAVFGNLEIHREYVHQGVDGRRILILHGDEFDSKAKSCANWVRRLFNRQDEAEIAVDCTGSLGESAAQAARKRGADVVVCGHSRRAEMRMIGDVLYCNDGDWVESCTSLIEDMNGRLRLIEWRQFRQQREATPVALPVGQAA